MARDFFIKDKISAHICCKIHVRDLFLVLSRTHAHHSRKNARTFANELLYWTAGPGAHKDFDSLSNPPPPPGWGPSLGSFYISLLQMQFL